MTETTGSPEQPRRRGDFLVPNTVIHDAVLEFGGHLTVGVALAAFGVVVLQSPVFNLSPLAISLLYVICLGGPGIWLGVAIDRLHTKLADYPKRALILTVVGGLLGIGSLYAVIEYNQASRVAAVCDRVETLPDNEQASTGRCQSYYSSRESAEAKLLPPAKPATDSR